MVVEDVAIKWAAALPTKPVIPPSTDSLAACSASWRAIAPGTLVLLPFSDLHQQAESEHQGVQSQYSNGNL
jgi:hypothetical protein